MKKKSVLVSLICLLICLLALPMTADAAKISRNKVTLIAGEKETLTLKSAGSAIKWSSSNKKVASVSAKGTIKAIKKGTCTITAQTKNKKYSCKVTVLPATEQNKAYKKLKDFILKNGSLNKQGNKCIYYSPTNGTTVSIIYDKNKNCLDFYGYTKLKADEVFCDMYVYPGLGTKVKFEYEQYNDYNDYASAYAYINPKTITDGAKLNFVVTNNEIYTSPAAIPDIANSVFSIHSFGWELLLLKTGSSFQKLGFSNFVFHY